MRACGLVLCQSVTERYRGVCAFMYTWMTLVYDTKEAAETRHA